MYMLWSIIMLNLAKTISLAKEKGLSNTFLAKKLGKSASLFVDWRKGKSKPSENDIVTLAELLNTTVDYLTDKTEQINKPSSEEKSLSVEDKEALKRFRLLDENGQRLALAQLDTMLSIQEADSKK